MAISVDHITAQQVTTAAGTGSEATERNHSLQVIGEDSAGDSGPAAVSFLETMVAINNLLWWYQHELENVTCNG